MHMADALISPAVGGTLWLISAGLISGCSRHVKQALNDRLIPLMGVLGAFIFAAQMINFAIPATGSSGHLGGALILAILLGPYAAFIVIASVLTVQALFFTDGGLLALGCNIFNLGVGPAFIAYPFIYKPIAGRAQGGIRVWLGAILAAIAGLQLGSFCVVLETTISGICDIPFKPFVMLMQPIHLAIGLVEGVATATLVSFVMKAQPATAEAMAGKAGEGIRSRWMVPGFLLLAVLAGGGLSWFSSTRPDGLEWALARTAPSEGIPESRGKAHQTAATIQNQTALMPDYSFPPAPHTQAREAFPGGKAGTSTAGLAGGLITLLLIWLIGLGLKRRKALRDRPPLQ